MGSFAPSYKTPRNIRKDYREAFNIIHEVITEEEKGESWRPTKPASNKIVWRYMNFTQFVSILERESLWFSAITEFDDPYETAFPKRNMEYIIDKIIEESDAEIEEDIKKSLVEGVEQAIHLNEGRYVSCWNIQDYQSPALWEQYIDSSQGIAIKTTVGNLLNSIEIDDSLIDYGLVEYVDYENDLVPITRLSSIYHKRRSFEHENEFRITFTPVDGTNVPDGDEGYGGVSIEVDLSKLIDELYLAPTSQNWFKRLVNEVLETHNIDCDVTKSKLYTRG